MARSKVFSMRQPPFSRAASAAFLLILTISGAAAAQGADFAKRYASTLDRAAEIVSYPWNCDKGDVWNLSSFSYDMGKDLQIKLGPSKLVIGRNGANALIAVVLADAPAPIVSTHEGDGEKAARVYMRFHPALISKLFPPNTIKGNGPEIAIIYAKWIIMHKINGSWQSENFPVIPTKESLILDVDTAEGTRRFYDINMDRRTVGYVAPFAKQTLPKIPDEAVTKDIAADALDKAWKAFDEQYAMFVTKPKLDWEKVRAKYKAFLPLVKTNFELAGVISEMAAELEDLHVWVKYNDILLAFYNRPRFRNGSWRGTENLIGRFEDTKKDLAFARSADGIGYINIYSLSNQELPRVFDEALEKLNDTWGLLIDLRFNGGGDELLARRIAGRFVDSKRIYNKNQYRSGAKHTDLGPKLAREFEPCGPWRYESPIVVLWGERTMSSAESFACMLAQCPQATTMGDRSAGSSANPRTLELPGKIIINIPRWLDLDINDKPIDAVGVKPAVFIKSTSVDYTNTTDIVTSAALAHLRKIDAGKRLPGKRSK